MTVSIYSTERYLPVRLEVISTPQSRSPDDLKSVLAQFRVKVSKRYLATERDTYCSTFTWDATRALAAEIPYWVNADGSPGQVGAPHEHNANRMIDWLDQHGHGYGWEECDGIKAQQQANLGRPVVACWKNPTGPHGHIMMVCPGIPVAGTGPRVWGAGRVNTEGSAQVEQFGTRPVRYYCHL